MGILEYGRIVNRSSRDRLLNYKSFHGYKLSH